MTMHVINRMTRKFLTFLIEDDYEACISLYMPMVKAGPDTRKNIIVFKDLCGEAEKKLLKYGVAKNEIAKLMAPLKNVGEDIAFWEESRPQGLAFFISDKQQLVYRAESEFPAESIVDKRFYIRPLLPQTQTEEQIYVVLLGRKNAQLAACSKNKCRYIKPLEELRSLKAFLAHHEFEKSLQHAASREAPHMHGQGAAGDKANDNRYLQNYYHAFKNWLQNKLPAGKNLYLAGDDDNIGLFIKTAEDMPRKTIPLIRKNIQALTDNELLQQVKDELNRLAKEENAREFERFLQMRNNEPRRALENEAGEIIAAAYANKIQTLFLPPEEEKVWGHFDAANQNIILDKNPDKAVGEELFNLAAIQTMRSGGAVLVNGNKNAAAICLW